MSRIRSIKGLSLASGIISLLAALYCANYASSAWFEIQMYELLSWLDPFYYFYYTEALFRLSVVVTVGVLGLISGIVVLSTCTSVENNLRSVGVVWIIFGIIALPALGGLFAIIAGALALAEHGDTGGIARTRPYPVRRDQRSPYPTQTRRVVCRSCNAVGDSEDQYCAICGAPMKG